MKLIQMETITEKKIRKTDGKVFEKTTVHKEVLLDDTTVPLKANLNEGMAIEVWDNTDGNRYTFSPEDFYNWTQSKAVDELPYLQVKIENEHDDTEYFYEYNVSIGWYEISSQSDVCYTLDVCDLFRMTSIFHQDFNSLQEIIILLTTNLDPSTLIYNPSEPFINRNCKISIDGVDVTNCFYHIDEWKITASETDTSSTLTVEGNYFDERIMTEHLYAVDKENHYHRLYARSVRINPYAQIAKQVVCIRDNKYQYEYDSEFNFRNQADTDFKSVKKTELQTHLAGEAHSVRVQELLSENNISEEIIKFCSVMFDVQNNFPWVATKTVTKDSIDEDWFYQTNIDEIVRTPYPQCVYLD